MSTFKLDDIRAAADHKYGSTDIEIGDETVHLLNPLRLSQDQRSEFSRYQEQLKAAQSDAEGASDDTEASLKRQITALEGLLRAVAATRSEGNILVDAIGGDLAVLAEVFEAYGKKEEAGEASPSRD